MVGSLAAAVSGVATKAETVVAAFAKKAEQNNGLTKKDILEFLAEMGQELRQPLSVINCTLSLVGEGSLGAVTDQQKKMISLATDSAQRLEHLTDKLVDISGVPMALVPDSRILGDMYDR
jgi:signal transduction histidine kinase